MIKKKRIFLVLSLFTLLFVGFSFAEDVKYAQTRMMGCTDYDIVIGDQVWAACNSNYELKNKTVHPETPLDMNGRSVGNYYGTHKDDGENENFSCPNGYVLPLYTDFKKAIPNETSPNIAKLKLAAGGLYSSYSNKITSFDTHGYYRIRGLSKELFVLSVGSQVYDSYTTVGHFYSIRCLRVAPATQEEKFGNLSLATDGLANPNFGIAPNEDFSITNHQNISASTSMGDPYVDAKMAEIYQCFSDFYSGHLANIQNAITTLTEDKEKSTDALVKQKYTTAISKLKKIKQEFIAKYSLVGKVSQSGSIQQSDLDTSYTVEESLDAQDYAYRLKFSPKKNAHVYAVLVIMADLYKRGYNIDNMYNSLDGVFIRETGKSFSQIAATIKTKMNNKGVASAMKAVKEALEGMGEGRGSIEDLLFEMTDNSGNEKIGFGDIVQNGSSSLESLISDFIDDIEDSRSGFGKYKRDGGYNDTYGGGNQGFNDRRGQNMAGGFDEVIGYSTTVKTSNGSEYKGSHFQYRSVNGSDGSFRQGSKRSLTDNHGNKTVYERVVVNNTDGSTEVYEGSTKDGSRSGVYTKTDSSGNVVEQKNITGTPGSSNAGTPGTSDTDEPTGSINPEKDNGGMAPGVFIGLLNLLGKSAFVNSFNSPNGAIDNGNPDADHEQGQGGLIDTNRMSMDSVINWGEDSCEVCNSMIGGINPGSYKAGQWTNRGGR